MLPYLHLGFIDVPTFGLFLWLGGVAAAWVLHANFKRNSLPTDAISVVALVMVAGVVGAKLWHELQDPREMLQQLRLAFSPGLSHPIDCLLSVLHWFSAGFAWFGGLLFGIAMLLWQGRVDYEGVKAGAFRMLDLAAPAAAIGYGIGRIGCLTSGDGDYGIATKLPWGVHVSDNAIDPPRPNPPDLKVQPTPIYELLFGLALGWYLWMRGKKGLPIGQITGEYLILSGIGRFLVEIVRRNPRLYWGMSNAQVASLLSVVAGIFWIVVARAQAKNIEPRGV